VTDCSECPLSLLCLSGTLDDVYPVKALCPYCSKFQLSKTDINDIIWEGFCVRRQTPARARGWWKNSARKLGSIDALREGWDPEGHLKRLLYRLCESCYATATVPGKTCSIYDPMVCEAVPGAT